MKTIEERADAYVERKAYIDGTKEQRKLTLEAFDEWLCRNSWITRDENNRKSLVELRNIIETI